MISGNVLLFKDIKISLGLLITARKMHNQFRENRCREMSTTANNLIRVSTVEPKIKCKSWFLASHKIKSILTSSPCGKSRGYRWGFIPVCVQNNRLLNLPLNSGQQCLPTTNRSEQHLNGFCRNIAILDNI